MELVAFIFMFLVVGGVIAGVAAVSGSSIEDLRKAQEYKRFQQQNPQLPAADEQQNPQNIPDGEQLVQPPEQGGEPNRIEPASAIAPEPEFIQSPEQEQQQNRIEPVSAIPPKPEFLQPPVYAGQPFVKIKPEKQRTKLPASAVMLIIGTIFIILAALTFVVANWVKFEPIGRVGALAGSAALAFTICSLMKAVAGLERTSGAFYTIGTIFTSISFLTAGYYELMGKWLSPDGDGAFMLYSLLSLLVASSFFISYPIYKRTACHYAGFGFVSSAIVLGCIQASVPAIDNIEVISLLLTIVGAVLIAIFHILKPFRGTVVEKPMYLIGDISAVAYTFSAVLYDIYTLFEPTECTFMTVGIIMAQLILYGFFKNQKWMSIFVNIFTAYIFISVCSWLDTNSEFSTAFVSAVLGISLAVLYAVNRVIPRNYTFSRIITLAAAAIGAIYSMVGSTGSSWLANFIAPAIVSVAIAEYALHKKKEIQIIAGLFAPVLPLMMAFFFVDRLEDFITSPEHGLNVLVFGALSLVYMAAAAFFIFLPKINFRLHANCPERSDFIVYMNMVASAVVLLCLSIFTELFVVTAGLIVIHFVLSHTMKNNIFAALSVIAGVILTYNIFDGYFNLRSDTVSYIMFALFAVLMAVSRIIFPEGFHFERDDKKIYDVLILSAWTALLPLSMIDRTAWFLRLISAAIFFAALVKRNTSKENAAILFSISATIAAFAFMVRPFLNPDESMIKSKITLGIIFLLGVAYRIIWKDFPNVSKNASTFIFIISFIGLMIDGLIYDHAGNRIFVLTVTAAILIWSFFIKSKTWFIVSSTALVIITAASTFKYFNKAGWWIYLLIVGVIFIVIATVNEVCRKKGGTVKSELLKHFSDWNW